VCANFEGVVAGLWDDFDELLREGKTHPWLQLTRLNPDKFFSDMIESIIGAIFVDSGGDLGECQRFIELIGLMSYMNRVVAGKVDISHPKTVLEKLAGAEGVDYDIREDESDGGEEEKLYMCMVNVGGVEIVEVKGCLSQDEAVVVGAWEGVEKLRAKREMRGGTRNFESST